ncbi:MAG: hypothetical protein U5J64_05365 [Halobacteriales archaeon]|nr:hypothetical protein [Halobacteriales archaeon]
MNDDEDLELFAERTYRLIVRLGELSVEAVENAVSEAFDAEFEDVDVSEFAVGATHAEFEGTHEGNDVRGTVSEDVNGVTVLTLQDIVYVDNAADRLDTLNDLLRDETLADAARRLREHDADENPLEKVL